MNLLLTRRSLAQNTTLGTLELDGGWSCCTLELCWLSNLPNLSCIPVGTYTIQLHQSPKFGDVYEVIGVPNRGDILIHVGNTRSDTHGCILLGMRSGYLVGLPAVLSSRIAFNEFMRQMAGIKTAQLVIEENYGSN